VREPFEMGEKMTLLLGYYWNVLEFMSEAIARDQNIPADTTPVNGYDETVNFRTKETNFKTKQQKKVGSLPFF